LLNITPSGSDTIIKNKLKNSNSIESTHYVVGQWNHNGIATIEDFGNYDQVLVDSNYTKGLNYSSGNHKVYYDSVDNAGVITEEEFDNTKLNKYYNLESCFDNFRPTAGVVRPMALGSNIPMFYLLNVNDLDKSTTSINKPYLGSYNQDFTYWTSARFGSTTEGVLGTSKTTALNAKYDIRVGSTGKGKIAPFVKYTNGVWTNTIRVVHQTHLGVPLQYKIQFLNATNVWTTAFDVLPDTVGIPTKNSNGVLEIYFDTDADNTWKILTSEFTPKPVTDLSITSDQAVKIYGLRLVVESMSAPDMPFELIELSPKLTVNLTDYVSNISFKTSVPDNPVGLPVGGITIGTGEITLSNENNMFLNTNTSTMLYDSMHKNTKIKVYQTLNDGTSSFNVPLKEMYAESWKEDSNFEVSGELYDFMKFLQSKSSNDIFISNPNVPVTLAIQSMLHNIGHTNFRILTNSNSVDSIQYFFSSREKTIAEVLSDIASATQSAIFIDANGNLTFASREYLMNPEAPESWWITTEDIDVVAGVASKPSFNSNPYSGSYAVTDVDYLANVSSLQKVLSDVVNDGDVAYKPRSWKSYQALPTDTFSNAAKKDIGVNPFAFQSKPSFQKVWSPGNRSSDGEGSTNSENILAGSCLMDTLKSGRLTDKTITVPKSEIASNPYSTLNDLLTAKVLSTATIDDKTKYITLSSLDMYTFPYSGYLRIDNEYVEFKGIEYIKVPVSKKGYSVNKYSRTTNVITLNTVEIHSFNINDSIVITGTEDINGVYSITATPDNFTIKFNKTGSNIAEKYSPYNSMVMSNISPIKYMVFSDVDKINNQESSKVGDVALTTGRIALKLEFEQTSSTSTDITYKVVSDGRGKFGTTTKEHIGMNSSLALTAEWKNASVHIYDSSMKFNEPSNSNNNGFSVQRSNESQVLDNIGSITTGAVVITGTKMNSGGDISEWYESVIDGDLTGLEAEMVKSMKLTKKEDAIIQGCYKKLDHVYTSYSARLAILQSQSRSSDLENLSNVPVAGIGIHVNTTTGEGYYLEFGASGGRTLINNNLRFYKVYSSAGMLKVKVLFVGTIENVNQNVITPFGDLSTSGADTGWTNLKVNVTLDNVFQIAAQNYIVGNVRDSSPLPKTNNIMMFVRGDGIAIFDKISAMSDPNNTLVDLPSYGKFNVYNAGNEDYTAVENSASRYYESFGKDVNELKLYDFKYNATPILRSVVADLSSVGAGYVIEELNTNSFGGKLKLRNKTGRTIILSDGTKNEVGIYGVIMKEDPGKRVTASGLLSDKSLKTMFLDSINQSKRKYGLKTFNIASDYIQTQAQASKLMQWILDKCSKPFNIVDVDIFPNPFLEIGDFVKIYTEKHSIPSSKFVITSIEYKVDSNGPDMSIELREVR
jgi:hypothetical protein